MTPLVAIATFVVVISSQCCLASPVAQDRQTQPPRRPAPTQAPSPYKDGMRVPAGNADLFAFPADPSTIDSKTNARNRTPVFIPDRCQENEILYPGDQDSDWVCDCKPTFVYHPPTRKCYQMYTQGYCPEGTMIYLQPDAKHPECVNNACASAYHVAEPRVFFNQSCVTLNAYHKGCMFGQLNRVIGIDEKTNELACVNLTEVKLPPVDEKSSPASGTSDRESGSVASISNNVQDFRGTTQQG
uniref:Putative conserved secreted protein n=1 Tax=Culex tarsalis TaxID=7177 RepID=A0A1Q3FKX0_CULTA